LASRHAPKKPGMRWRIGVLLRHWSQDCSGNCMQTRLLRCLTFCLSIISALLLLWPGAECFRRFTLPTTPFLPQMGHNPSYGAVKLLT
jgi:hypothetical protein